MNEKKIDEVVDSFLNIFPAVTKYFLMIGQQCFDPNYVHQHYQVLFALRDSGRAPISSIGATLGISKARMSVLLDKLINEELVERFPDKGDRRVIKIELTEKGKAFTLNHIKDLRAIITERFCDFSDDELEQFLTSATHVYRVMAKINTERGKK